MNEKKAIQEFDLNGVLPEHVAVILDGNGRWAKEKGKSVFSGHKAGVRAVRKAIEYASYLGLKVLSIYAFSKENWSRSEEEVTGLMNIFLTLMRLRRCYLKSKQIKVTFIGDRLDLSDNMVKEMEEIESLTINNTGVNLVIAVNYSGQWDILQATNRAIQAREMVDEKSFESYLATAGLPNVDLLIRTSGEERLSNFFLWQSAYAEFVFVSEYWPEFDAKLFQKSLTIFQNRNRRFGKRD